MVHLYVQRPYVTSVTSAGIALIRLRLAARDPVEMTLSFINADIGIKRRQTPPGGKTLALIIYFLAVLAAQAYFSRHK